MEIPLKGLSGERGGDTVEGAFRWVDKIRSYSGSGWCATKKFQTSKLKNQASGEK